MDKQQKESQVKALTEAFAKIQGAVLTGVSGLTVAEATQIRRKFHQAGVEYRVVKNTLARIAANTSDLKAISELFVGPTAIAWHNTDPTAAARAALDVKKDLEKLELKGGYMGGRPLKVADLKAVADLPTLPEIRAQILGM